jgi:hypothetical protein
VKDNPVEWYFMDEGDTGSHPTTGVEDKAGSLHEQRLLAECVLPEVRWGVPGGMHPILLHHIGHHPGVYLNFMATVRFSGPGSQPVRQGGPHGPCL